ncbi:MAG TPA: glucose 1-dehydrogenase [Candidatus Dormibacteraeota bacterium]|nr:glucose 1-dehydrogenase [Candidatus Dormibacteraeota bacterium]
MQAIAITPGQAGSVRLESLPQPALDEVADGRGVLVRVLRVGLDGTDREIYDAKYGAAPSGYDFLVPGHEGLGVVEAVGENVTELAPGDHVVAIVRRPGTSRYDRIGLPDFTTDDTYFEHGISRLHGYLTERYVDTPEYLIRIPVALADLGVLLEPISIAEKGVAQAYEIQRRLRIWDPRRAAVLGAGPLGIFASMVLRLRGLAVVTVGLDEPPYLNSELVEAIGAHYVSTKQRSLADVRREHGPFDLMFEGTGYSPMVFDAMQVLAKDGVLVLSSVTGGDRTTEVPSDAINLSFVLGNKVMVGTVNASRENFEAGVRDLAMAEAQWPGWLGRLITHRVAGLGNYRQAFDLLTSAHDAIKIVVEVAAGEPATASSPAG